MTLTERIAAAIQTQKRLRAVPPAVIEDVLRLGIDWLADHVPAATRASELTSIDWEACEACGHLIDPADPEGATTMDSDGIWLCNACVTERPAPAPVKESADGS